MITRDGSVLLKGLATAVRNAANVFGKMTDIIADFYSSMLERRVDRSQTIALLEAQTAFLFGIMPMDMPILLRLFFTIWTVVAVARCRRRLGT